MKQIASTVKFPLSHFAAGHLAGTRAIAVPLRVAIEQAYCSKSGDIILDFKAVEVTQSFMDEVIGRLILSYGPDVLKKLIFKNCSNDVKAIIKFIAADRSDQYLKQNTH